MNTAKVKQVYKQDADIGVAIREAAQKVKDASGDCGDAEWQGAFNLANSIKVQDDGSVKRTAAGAGGKVTSFDEWRRVLAEENNYDKAVESYNSLAKGEKVAKEKPKTKEELRSEEAVEEAANQRLRIKFLQTRMKDAERAYNRNMQRDPHIAAQAKAIVEECKAELGEANKDATQAEAKMHLQKKKTKKFKF